jgi:ubiquinone/menaquinone biosynthesis C-methylase UbiE
VPAAPEARFFQSNVAFYQRYRLDYPPRLITRVIALSGLNPGDAVLDLGCGPGNLALGFARAGMTVTALDPEPEMLAAARQAATVQRLAIDCQQRGSAELTPADGPFRLAAIGRAFHWMDRAVTLAMLDRIIAPGGGVALFHDAHPPVEENRWFRTLHDVTSKFGRDEAEHVRERNGGHRRYEPFLFASAFTELDWLSVTIRRAVTEDEIVGLAFSMSTCSPQRLGTRAAEFEATLRAALRKSSPDGTFTEVAELVALLARRPQ